LRPFAFIALSSLALGSAACVNARAHSAGAAASGEGREPRAVSPSNAELDAGSAPLSEDSGPDFSDAAGGNAPDACPSGMKHVQHAYCPVVARRCEREEYDKSNHITICERFAEHTGCQAPRLELDFCIDEYEFPNQKGAHPPVMVSWHDAKRSCAAAGKRLCKESEWVAACEGPEEKPFPYGYRRSAAKCNIDNPWVAPNLGKLYSSDAAVSRAELERLDRSVPSGARPECVSDYGVFDLTGNVDEWVLADKDRPKERGRGSGLKGGAWGHVRNACRPVTTSHAPEFRYYFVSFRCCRDPG
jgi:hypothetical protein